MGKDITRDDKMVFRASRDEFLSITQPSLLAHLRFPVPEKS